MGPPASGASGERRRVSSGMRALKRSTAGQAIDDLKEKRPQPGSLMVVGSGGHMEIRQDAKHCSVTQDKHKPWRRTDASRRR